MKKSLKMDKKIIYLIILITIFLIMFSDLCFASGKYPKLPQAWKELIDEYRVILAGIAGVGALTSVLVFIIHMINLASPTANPKHRRKCLNGIIISGICTALLGGITIILTLFYTIIFLE